MDPPLLIFVNMIWNHAESWLDCLIRFFADSYCPKYRVMRYYGHALKYTRIIVRVVIPDSRITLIPLVRDST